MKTLIICCDGTRNGRDDEHSTNVLKLHRALRSDNQIPMYFAGPGNEDENNTFGEIFGALFGFGSNEIRDMAINQLASLYMPGDRIIVIGFSRGAAVARMICSKLFEEGVGGHMPSVEALCCFDTVGAYLPFGRAQQGLFHDLHVSTAVKNVYHALAIDEVREAFIPNLMNQRDGIHECWFIGGHCDVGGGNPDTSLSDIALEWMIENLAKHDVEVGPINRFPDPMGKITAIEWLRNEKRRLGVKANDDWSDETVNFHQSVMIRQQADANYKPLQWIG